MVDDRLDNERRLNNERRRHATQRLQAAIEGVRSSKGEALDEYGSNVISRLGQDRTVVHAIAKTSINDRALHGILLSCIEAEHLDRNFHPILAKGKTTLARLAHLTAAADELTEFVRGAQQPNISPLEATVCDPGLGDIEHGLYLVRQMIELRQRIIIETAGRLGATRKRGWQKAARIAAVSWLVQGVERSMASARPRLAAVFAQAMFPEDAIDEGNLRKASATRRAKTSRPATGRRGTFARK
jgi:hypothetical protein